MSSSPVWTTSTASMAAFRRAKTARPQPSRCTPSCSSVTVWYEMISPLPAGSGSLRRASSGLTIKWALNTSMSTTTGPRAIGDVVSAGRRRGMLGLVVGEGVYDVFTVGRVRLCALELCWFVTVGKPRGGMVPSPFGRGQIDHRLRVEPVGRWGGCTRIPCTVGFSRGLARSPRPSSCVAGRST